MKSLPRFLLVLAVCALAKVDVAGMPDDSPKSAFSIVVSAPTTTVKAGEDLKVEVTITNTSDHDIFYGAQNEIPFGLEVRDSGGGEVSKTPDALRAFNGLTDGSSFALSIHPGESLDRERLLNKDFELRKPGAYTVWATRMFGSKTADSKIVTTTAKSNIVTITIVP